MIRTRARARLTPTDMEFILESVAGDEGQRRAMMALAREEDFVDRLLDRPELFERIVGERKLTRISPSLYFYVLMRHGLMESGIDDRDVADYTATLLTDFAARERLYRISPAHDEIFETLVDMLGWLNVADRRDRFLIRTHIGNYTLFFLGLFIDHLRARERGRTAFPGVHYYEDMGRMSYREASENQLAEQLDLAGVLSVMAGEFHRIRKSMNRITRRYLHLRPDADPPGTVTGGKEESWN
jgi:hypothetical protein